MIEIRLIGPLEECQDALARIGRTMRVGRRNNGRPKPSRYNPAERLVDAVIERYPVNEAGWRPRQDWTAEEWTAQVRLLRDALAPLGLTLPQCLPGESEDCDIPLWEHYATYLGALQARVTALVEINVRTGAEEELRSGAYEHFLGEYRREAAGNG